MPRPGPELPHPASVAPWTTPPGPGGTAPVVPHATPTLPDHHLPGRLCSTRLRASTWLRPRLSVLGDAATPFGF
jgi:hypothetical protein